MNIKWIFILGLFFIQAISSVYSQETYYVNENVGTGNLFVTEGAPIEAVVTVNGGSATIKSSLSVSYTPGTWVQTGSFLESRIDETIPINESDIYKNWLFARTFDENGEVTSESKSYYDNVGKPTQSQWKDLTNNTILGSHIVYDAHGRDVATTLSAPINKNGYWGYDNNFITNNAQRYTYEDFDQAGTGYGSVNNPKQVDLECTLGEYYSNNNTDEPYVHASSYPYSRVEYNPHFPGQVRRSSAAGEEMKMGMGHEAQSYELSIGYGELNAYNPNIPADFKGTKTLAINNNGNEAISYSNLSGETIATCLTGSTKSSDIKTIGQTIIYNYKTPFVIHVPEGLTTLNLKYINSSSEYHISPLHVTTAPQLVVDGSSPLTLQQGVYAISFYDNIGHYNGEIESMEVNYHSFTWFEYDKAGRLVKTTDPKGIVSSNTYKANGKLLSSEHPDEGLYNYYYHEDGRIKASVNAQQRFDAATDNVRYSYTLYDEDYRIIEVGVCEETGNESTHHFSPVAYNTRSDVTRTGYDYPDPDLLNTYPSCGLTQQNLRGMVSHTESGVYTSNYNTSFSAHYKTWYSYDHYGRVEWTAQHHKDLGLKVTQYEYHVNGKVERVVFQPNNNAERMEHIYAYDKDTRLHSVTSKKTNNTDVYEQTTSYKYYMHGPLKRVEVGNGLQGIDYVYNINGQLKCINNAGTDLVYNGEPLDPGKDGYGTSAFPKDVFGMSLDYYEGDYARSGTYINTNIVNGKSQYNGNLHSIRWKTPRLLEDYPQDLEYPHNVLENNKEWAYVFDYNDRNWLSEAKFGTYQHGFTGNGTFTENQYYKVNDLNYDENGNITSLDRSAIYGNLNMDNMSYSYYTASNKLQNVTDVAVNNGDLNDIPQGQIDFQYNDIGQLIQKTTTPVSGDASVQTMQYDAYGKLKQVTDAVDTYAIYNYNDHGYRANKRVANQGNITTTNYIYDINGNVLAIYNGAELIEQPVYGSGRIGSFMNQSKKYFYELKDHLGNVRAVVSRNAEGNLEVNEYCSYYPYGMPMPDRRLRSAEKYRYGFQGEFAEEDDETGYNFFELRAYDSRLGRWMVCDPAGQFASPYVGMGNNPVNGVDPDGGKVYIVNVGTSRYPRYQLFFTDVYLDVSKTLASATWWGALAMWAYDEINGYTLISKCDFEDAMGYVSKVGAVISLTAKFMEETSLGRAFDKASKKITILSTSYDLLSIAASFDDYKINEAVKKNFHFMVFRTEAETITGYGKAYEAIKGLINSGDLTIEYDDYGVPTYNFTENGQAQVDELNDVFMDAYFDTFGIGM